MAYQRIILQSGFTNLMAYVSEAKLHRIFPRFMPVPKVGSVTKERAVVRLQATAEARAAQTQRESDHGERPHAERSC